jgi:hypothetical protein
MRDHRGICEDIEIATTLQAGQPAAEARFGAPLVAPEYADQRTAMNQAAINPNGPTLVGDQLPARRGTPELLVLLVADIIGHRL